MADSLTVQISIAWDRTTTLYYFDGQLLDGPIGDGKLAIPCRSFLSLDAYVMSHTVSQNPSNMVFNHWASGNIGFFGVSFGWYQRRLSETDLILVCIGSSAEYDGHYENSICQAVLRDRLRFIFTIRLYTSECVCGLSVPSRRLRLSTDIKPGMRSISAFL